MNFWIKFCVLNLFLEDIHVILFLPKISCASTKLSTQLSETVEESFSSDITRTHCYKTAILNNVARSMSTGNDTTWRLRKSAVTWEQSDARQPEVFIWHNASQRFLNLGKNWKQAEPLFYKVYIYFLRRSLNKEVLASFFNVGQSLFPSPMLFKKVSHSSKMVLIVGKGLKQFSHIEF